MALPYKIRIQIKSYFNHLCLDIAIPPLTANGHGLSETVRFIDTITQLRLKTNRFSARVACKLTDMHSMGQKSVLPTIDSSNSEIGAAVFEKEIQHSNNKEFKRKNNFR